MKKITFLLCMLSLIFAGSLIGCSEAQNNPSNTQIPNDVAGAKGPKSVDLGTSGDFVILSKAGVANSSPSTITGDIGTSPIDSTALTGFSPLAMDISSGEFSKSAQVTGKLYAADYTEPTPTKLTAAVGDMEIAYTDAAGRVGADFTNLYAGNIGGKTLVPGLYKWGTAVSILTNVTLAGGPDDVWIFQIAGGITVASTVKVALSGGALAKNIFWQSSDQVTIGTSAQFEGIILSSTGITMLTGSTINGRLLAQSAVILQSSTVTEP